MNASSSRTINFLLTDIEGSTRLWERNPEAMKVALSQHDALMNEAIVKHGGQVFKTMGDAFFAVFPNPADGLEAARSVQRLLLAADWGETIIKVRMILHSGVAEARDGDYFGPAVNRAARLLAAAHGGQILVSAVSRALIQDQLPAECWLRDMGEHRLKDLERAERIYQLLAPELPGEFGPLNSLSAYPNNLPVQLSSFVGREREIKEISGRLSKDRLVTLVGSGGTGKTRLAHQAAAELLQEFPDGVWLVELASLNDPKLLPQKAASVLKIREENDRPILESLVAQLAAKQALIIFDNCEHLILDCAKLAERLLAAASGLRILATSREGLGLAGEITIVVPPLSLPADDEQVTVQYSSVRLFMERAAATDPNFKIDDSSAAAVGQICRRLDGIPLAIELAAARLKVLSVEEIADRVEDRFHLLTGGSRTAVPRHQTLRAMMDWSYDLLFDAERLLFQRLAVFSGGWTLTAAEEICSCETVQRYNILDLILQLTNKSLVIADHGRGAVTRYTMLETIRQYGLDRLIDSGEVLTIRGQHLAYFLALAEKGEDSMSGPGQEDWFGRLENEHDNLRGAIEWGKRSDVESSLRLASALQPFFVVRGYLSEGRNQLTSILSAPGAEKQSVFRAKALAAAGQLAYRQSDYSASRSYFEESLAISREVGDSAGIARSLIGLGNTDTEEGRYDKAPDMFNEALRLSRQVGDEPSAARALVMLGWAALRKGEYDQARMYLEEALGIYQAAEDKRNVAFVLAGLGEAAVRQDDLNQAAALAEESLVLRRQIGDQWGIGVSLGTLGWIAQSQEDYKQASQILTESFNVRQAIDEKGGMAWCLERLAEVAKGSGDLKQSVRLFASAAALREAIGSSMDPVDQSRYEQNIEELKETYPEAEYARLWKEGIETEADVLVGETS